MNGLLYYIVSVLDVQFECEGYSRTGTPSAHVDSYLIVDFLFIKNYEMLDCLETQYFLKDSNVLKLLCYF